MLGQSRFLCCASGCPGVPAVPSVCPQPAGSCPSGAFYPSPIVFVNATLWPSRLDLNHDVDKLTDGQYTSNFGAWATVGKVNYLQVTLDRTYDAALSLEVWAGDGNYWSSSGYLTVYASTTSNFTATGMVCVRGTAITTGTSGVITCPALTGALYGE